MTASIRLGRFDGRVAAVYTGPDAVAFSRQVLFLSRSATGEFREERAPFDAQRGTAWLDFVQAGAEVVVVQGGRWHCTELRRGADGRWAAVAMPQPPEAALPALALFQGAICTDSGYRFPRVQKGKPATSDLPTVARGRFRTPGV